MEGAIGIKQLQKIDRMLENRRVNAKYFLERMKEFPEIRTQQEVEESSWFGFSLVLTGKLTGKRDGLVNSLKEANIECRPIVAGNFTRNTVIKYMNYRIPEELANADEIHYQGLFIGNHSRINKEQVDYFISVLRRFVSGIN